MQRDVVAKKPFNCYNFFSIDWRYRFYIAKYLIDIFRLRLRCFAFILNSDQYFSALAQGRIGGDDKIYINILFRIKRTTPTLRRRERKSELSIIN